MVRTLQWLGALPDRIKRRRRAAEAALPKPVRRFERWARGPELSMTSASLAFYALVSLPPMVLVAFWLAGMVASDEQLAGLVDEMGRRAPAELPLDGLVRG